MRINKSAAFSTIRRDIVIVLLAATAIAPSTCNGAELFGITFEDELIRIDPQTAQGTFVGTVTTNRDPPIGLAHHDSQLFTYIQRADVVVQINPATAETHQTFDVGIDAFGGGGIAFRSDGAGFMVGNNPVGSSATLYEFDIMTLTSRPIDGIGGIEEAMDGIAFDAAGTLYGLQDDNVPNLYTINPETGELGSIGPIGVDYPENGVGGLAFAADGTLFAAIDAALYTLDLNSGAATLVGPIGFDGVTGMTFFDPPLDFNGDGDLDVQDIDALVREIVAGTDQLDFDVYPDGSVDTTDLDHWRMDAADRNGFSQAYQLGDANLNGMVDAIDLNKLALHWNQDADLWSAGDFDANGRVDARDLNSVAVNWRQTILDSAASVPEPSTLLLALVGFAMFWSKMAKLQQSFAQRI